MHTLHAAASMLRAASNRGAPLSRGGFKRCRRTAHPVKIDLPGAEAILKIVNPLPQLIEQAAESAAYIT